MAIEKTHRPDFSQIEKMRQQLFKYFVFCFFCFIFALPPAADAEAPIVLQRADLLRTEPGPAGPLRYLDGNVWITQDTLSITGDHAIYDEVAGQLLFTGHVHFKEPTRNIWADQAIYYEKDGRAQGEGHVRIEQDSIMVTCNKVIYHEAREEANFFGNVRLHSLKENAILTGNHGAYNRTDERGAMSQQPRLVRYFSDTDSMVVVGNVIEYLFKDKSATVNDDVHIRRNDFEARGGKLYYKDEAEHSRLVGNPVLQRNRDILQADTVDAYFEEDKIRRVFLRGQAVATSPADSLLPEPINKITGQSMEIAFHEGELDSIFVRGNATSLYFIREKDSEKGANVVSGDAINIALMNNQINWIYVLGGTEGVYYPEHLEQLAQARTPAVLAPERER